MVPLKLAELQKQSKKLLGTGFSRPVQAPYRTLVLSIKKKDNNLRWMKYFWKSDIRLRYCRVRATEAKGLETTCVTEHEAYEFPVVPFSLTDAIATFYVPTNKIFQDHLQKGFQKLEENQSIAKGGRCCFVQGQINMLGHVVEFYIIDVGKRKIAATQFVKGFLKKVSSPTELLKENIQWGGNPDWQAAFDDKQATIERPSLGVADATKPSKDEAKVEKEWEQMADIAWVCLEEASRPMEKRSSVNLKHEEDREVKEVLADRVRKGRRPTREIHKFLVKWKNLLMEVTSRECVKDLEAWKQKTEELQLCRLTRTTTV
ncbi:hypothetical protein E5676_scaffold832G001430 [Cucumis melo var. makuwa]|nr:hypothetical protein E5676_scaffold832G001430 [Cucumis melo var. makuwa]